MKFRLNPLARAVGKLHRAAWVKIQMDSSRLHGPMMRRGSKTGGGTAIVTGGEVSGVVIMMTPHGVPIGPGVFGGIHQQSDLAMMMVSGLKHRNAGYGANA